ncbi:MAG: hypothetical protein V4476_05405 [Pseudomonadota bacterium]
MVLRSDYSQWPHGRIPLRGIMASAWPISFDRRNFIAAFDKEQRKHYNYSEVLALWVTKTHKNQSSFVPTAASHIPYPASWSGGWVCNCRANRDGRCLDNYSIDNKQSAMAKGKAKTLSEAKKSAEKSAKEKLGAKSTHHVQCRCTGPKGERVIPHG